ncbi:MAG: TolB family protein, partial [Vicinamibacterales bacterium]
MSIAIGAAGWLTRPAPDLTLRKLELALPGDGFGFALSPNGRHVAFRQQSRIVVSDLDRLELRNLAESSPPARNAIFWSPDSLFIGYSDADGRLWSVPTSGGTPRLICTIPETRQLMGAAWLTNATIAFSVWRGNLYHVAATGGPASPLLTIDPKTEIDVHEVVGLPDGRVLAATHLNTPDPTNLSYRIEIVTPTSRTVAFDAPLLPIARTSNGYLLTRRADVNAGVWAFRDTGRWPLRIEDGFLAAPGAEQPSGANDGSLLYSLSSSGAQLRELVWVDRSGQVLGQVGTAQPVLSSPALSPDGQRVAFATHDGSNFDVYVHDLTNNIPSRVTTEADEQVLPSWFPGGRGLLFAEWGRTERRMVMRNADGSGPRQELGVGNSPIVAPDGRHILFTIDEQGVGR